MATPIIPRTRVGIREWMKRKLGQPKVRVHLDKLNWDDSINDALAWFFENVGFKRRHNLTLVDDTAAYELPDDVDDVLELTPYREGNMVPPMGSFGVDPSGQMFSEEGVLFIGQGVGVPQGGGMVSQLAERLIYSDAMGDMLGTELDWDWDEEARRLLILNPLDGIGGKIVQILYRTNKLEEDFVFESMMPKLTLRQFNMIRMWALAEAMENLANVIGKYENIPGSSGELRMNADAMRSSAEAEKERLRDKLMNEGFPAPFYVR